MARSIFKFLAPNPNTYYWSITNYPPAPNLPNYNGVPADVFAATLTFAQALYELNQRRTYHPNQGVRVWRLPVKALSGTPFKLYTTSYPNPAYQKLIDLL